MLSIIDVTTDLPQVRLHGLATTGCVLLFEEGGTVRGCVLERLGTCLDSCRDCREAALDLHLFGRERCGTFVAICVEGVDTLAVGVGRFCRSVRHNEVVTVIVSVHFLGTFECALDVSIPAAPTLAFAIVKIWFNGECKNV